MTNWLKRLFSPSKPQSAPPAGQAAPGAEAFLRMENEQQEMRMELQAREKRISELKQEVERLRARQEHLIAESVTARLEGLFSDLAAPASQVLTQADLLEKQGKPLQARDVLAVARRMVRALERQGIRFAGQVGEQVSYDPDQHTLINPAAAPQPGQPVTVRFAGVIYLNKTLYKAIVE